MPRATRPRPAGGPPPSASAIRAAGGSCACGWTRPAGATTCRTPASATEDRAPAVCPPANSKGSRASARLPKLQHRQERLLRHLDASHLLHPLLALLLLLEQLALAGDVAAVALGRHVLAVGLDRLAGHDARADRGLD